jgi:hypothetical protein
MKMRDPVNAFYYPDMAPSDLTLKKAILFFDEIHFIDRASFFFGGGGQGQIGSIGCASPLRAYEQSFRENGVPLYVHEASSGPIDPEILEQVSVDINDRNYLSRFQRGLESSKTFRDIQIPPGNYGESGMQEDLVRTLVSLNLGQGLAGHPIAMDLLTDGSVEPFKTRTEVESARVMIQYAAFCSAKINFALRASSSYGMVPFADATPFGDLLGSKYHRAIAAAQNATRTVQLTDLSFKVFDELLPSEVLTRMSFREIVRYRRESEGAREEFLEHLSGLQAKQGAIAPEDDYNSTVSNIVISEITPAARAYQKKLEGITETFFGSIAKGVLGTVGAGAVGAVGLTLFGALTWPHLIAFAGPAAAYVGNAAIDGLIASRAATRECSISYVLSLDS